MYRGIYATKPMREAVRSSRRTEEVQNKVVRPRKKQKSNRKALMEKPALGWLETCYKTNGDGEDTPVQYWAHFLHRSYKTDPQVLPSPLILWRRDTDGKTTSALQAEKRSGVQHKRTG